jgi:hypothetical protein
MRGWVSLAMADLALERHFTPIELAQLWNFTPGTIRELFTDEPGVIRPICSLYAREDNGNTSFLYVRNCGGIMIIRPCSATSAGLFSFNISAVDAATGIPRHVIYNQQQPTHR